MLFALATACFGAFWVATLLYVRAAHGLVECVKDDHPEFWRDTLGAPHRASWRTTARTA